MMGMPSQPHGEIVTAEDGSLSATVGPVEMRVDPGGKMYNRNAIEKHLPTGDVTHHRWLVAELDGVRVYLAGTKILVTKRDIHP